VFHILKIISKSCPAHQTAAFQKILGNYGKNSAGRTAGSAQIVTSKGREAGRFFVVGQIWGGHRAAFGAQAAIGAVFINCRVKETFRVFAQGNGPGRAKVKTGGAAAAQIYKLNMFFHISVPTFQFSAQLAGHTAKQF
jgi:hypothetical protein